MKKSTQALILAIFSALLFVPQIFSSRWDELPGHIGLARVHSGDEPHYMVLLSSVVIDQDLDVSNNYASVHAGGFQAGTGFRGHHLDHHTGWYENGKFVRWYQRFENEPRRWRRSYDGWPLPTLRPGVPKEAIPEVERSMHWPGQALILAPVLLPFRGSEYLEPAAILCSWAVTVLAMLAFVSLAGFFSSSPRNVLVATGLLFLGTPIWHYSRTLFSEPYLLACVVGAYQQFIVKKRYALSGALIGAAVLMKGNSALLGLPLGIFLLSCRRWKHAFFFALGPAAAIGASLWLNHRLFGGIFNTPQDWLQGSLLKGTIGYLTDDEHGLLLYTPIALSALIGWPLLARRSGWKSALPAAAFLAHFVLCASYANWHGGYCFGPRYLVPVLPFLFLGLLSRLEQRRLRLFGIFELTVLGLVSFAINLMGAVPYWRFWSEHPFASFFG